MRKNKKLSTSLRDEAEAISSVIEKDCHIANAPRNDANLRQFAKSAGNFGGFDRLNHPQNREFINKFDFKLE